MRRVNWSITSITTSTQCVRKVSDSQRNRSALHKLSFVWPRKVSQEGPPDPDSGRKCFPKIRDIFVDIDTEGQGDLLSNSGTAPTGIASFHFNDGIEEFFGRSSRTRLTTTLGRKQHVVLSFRQHVVEMQ